MLPINYLSAFIGTRETVQKKSLIKAAFFVAGWPFGRLAVISGWAAKQGQQMTRAAGYTVALDERSRCESKIKHVPSPSS